MALPPAKWNATDATRGNGSNWEQLGVTRSGVTSLERIGFQRVVRLAPGIATRGIEQAAMIE